MSREHSTRAPRRVGVIVRRLAAVTIAGTALGCGRGDANGEQSVGRAGADSVWHAPGTQAGNGADAAPTPGFTSAQGTPATQPVAVAPAAVAARLAPPPSALIANRTGEEEQAAIRALPADSGRDLVLGNCLICHAATMITQQHKDTAGWNKTVTQMVAWGAPVRSADRQLLVAYLAAHYPARGAGRPARQAP